MNPRSPTVAKVQPLRERIKAATGEAILDAAEEILAAEGVASASLLSVAERAGVAVGTIYNHFSDKDELFRALFARRRAEIVAAIGASARASAKEPFEAQLAAFLRSIFAAFDERRRFLRIAMETDQLKAKVVTTGEAQATHTVMHERATQIVRVGIREKVLREGGADLYPFFLTSLLRGVLLARLDDPKPLVSDVDRVVQMFLHGAAR